ncbi:MAG: ASKHA domain-containing protein [Thermincola sp.]|jgi:uncharacterized 2Fe-2S/4Fe-4S cluster protein (DUF4445 family)|nr:ASKHA domain-containing protein [Thermincola sp.]MDT3703295.1 ASKHA domain-containing protein [Thermincola sp.]
MVRCKVFFQPENREAEVVEGSTLMQVINEAGLQHDFPCGGMGKCGKCRVKITKGTMPPTVREQEILEAKEIMDGIRLACLTKVQNDMVVELSTVRKNHHNILMSSAERPFSIEPHLQKIFIKVEKPMLHDQRSDWHRVKDSLSNEGYVCSSNVQAPLSVLRQLPGTIREADHSITLVTKGSEVLAIEPQDTTKKMLGMAFDIGTTTIVGYLLDLYSGEELGVASTLNPQTKFGADVISRVNFAGQAEDGLFKLQNTVLEAINRLIGEAAEGAGVNRSDIYGTSIAANTCMHHLFLGISPKNIAFSPYVSVIAEPVVVGATELSIDINPGGQVFVLPNVAGFVGADTTAVLLAAELERSEDIKLILDIGTNGEIALGSKFKIAACSAAAGPAFEGAQISSGMRGADGAIDHVYFGEQLEYSVIGGKAPLGICGSALLDTVSGLVELGIIDKRGRILTPEKLTSHAAKRFENHIVKHEGQPAFLLVVASKTGHGRPIMVTQNDIRQLQLAKGAMAAGVRVLMETLGIGVGDIKEVLLAGAFGNYLKPHSACVIGLIPKELEGKIKMIGNAAGTGARMALLSAGEFRRAGDIAGAVEFVELGSHPKFNSIFGQATYFDVQP